MSLKGIPIWVVAAIALAPAVADAAAEQLKGSRFIEVMQDNTLSGTTEGGAAYNLYFCPAARSRTTIRPVRAIAAAGRWTPRATCASALRRSKMGARSAAGSRSTVIR
jgi:hypothetical protein